MIALIPYLDAAIHRLGQLTCKDDTRKTGPDDKEFSRLGAHDDYVGLGVILSLGMIWDRKMARCPGDDHKPRVGFLAGHDGNRFLANDLPPMDRA